MKTRIFLTLFLSVFGLMILGSVITSRFDPDGSISSATIGSMGLNVLNLVYFALFCVMSFSIVPLVIRLFIVMQIRIGNGAFFLVKFFQEHERAIVYAVWTMMLLGFAIIFTLGGKEILQDFK